MHFDGDDVSALPEERGLEVGGAGVGVVLGVSCGVGVVRNVATGHVVAHCLNAVDIDNHSVVDGERKAERLVARGRFGKVERCAEIVGRILVVDVISVADDGVIVTIPAHEVTQRSRARSPRTIVVVSITPVDSVERTLVVVAPGLRGGEEFAAGVRRDTPTREDVARRSFGLDNGGRVVFAVELAGGDGHAIERKACHGDICLKLCHAGGLRRQLHAAVALEQIHHGVLPCCRERRPHAIGAIPGRFVVVERLGVRHAVGHAFANLGTARRFEHRVGDEAERVDELLAEGIVVEQIEEDGDNLDLLGDVLHRFAVEAVESIDALVGEVGEWRTCPV